MEKKKILLIDDEEKFTQLVKANLEQTGNYQVRTENKGSLGLEAARQFKPDLILLDIIMPDLDGAELLHRLERDVSTKDIPVVILTALASKQDSASGASLIGGRPVIAKPVSTEELVFYIEKNIRKK